MKEILSKLFGKTKENKTTAIIAAILTVVLAVTAVGVAHSAQHRGNLVDNPSSSEPVSSEPISEDAALEEESQIVESDEADANEGSSEGTAGECKEELQPSDTEDTASSKPSSKPSVKPTTNNKPTSTTSSSSSSAKKDWFDNSGLTGTQADVGKVVGYNSMFAENITVVSVTERASADGRKVIQTNYSDGTVTKVVECEYCHKFPCPNGGGKGCSEYNAEEDAAVTCQTCGRPRGNGYNGTCKNLIDWENGGKISCNHYD